jgi:hypothetical protein
MKQMITLPNFFAAKLLVLCLLLQADYVSAKSFLMNSGTIQGDQNLVFIENKGQWDSEVLYLCRLGGMDAWIKNDGVSYTFYENDKKKMDEEGFQKGHRVNFELVSGNADTRVESIPMQGTYYNYLIGNDVSKHRVKVPVHREVIVKNIYDNIDIRYYFDSSYLRFDFIAAPKADISRIAFKLIGQDETTMNNHGDLILKTNVGEVSIAGLKTFQSNQELIPSHFVKSSDIWTINVDNYDNTRALIIDPLVFSTFIGGSIFDVSYKTAINEKGELFITGETQSSDYDNTPGAFQRTNAGMRDVFVSRLNETGTALIYSTYLGGSSDDYGHGIAVDNSGNVYVTGRTNSTNFPVTQGAFQTVYGGGTVDVFVTKLNPEGTSLVYSTFIGGALADQANAIAVDNEGHAYITGWTSSLNYRITQGAFQTTNGGTNSSADVFVTKVNPAGNGLVYSTYIGGTGNDYGNDITIDADGNAYITGYTQSGGTTATTNYDFTAGAFQTKNDGGFDAIVTKVNNNGTALLFSTYLGGSGTDMGNGIFVDQNRDVYVIGYTASTNFDVTPNAYRTAHNGGFQGNDIFITKFNSTGSQLVFSTYVGGNGQDTGSDLAVDAGGNVFFTGQTTSANFPVSSDALQSTYGGGSFDAVVGKLSPAGTELLYSGFLGGSLTDNGTSIKLDRQGNVLVTGTTNSTDFVTTAQAHKTTNTGLNEIFVAKLNLGAITGINELLKNNVLQIYPNPAKSAFVVKGAIGEKVEIFDSFGRVVYSKVLQFDNQLINLILTPGVYNIKSENRKASKLILLE